MKYSKNDLQKMILNSKSQDVIVHDQLQSQKANMKKVGDALINKSTIIILK